MGEPTKVAIIDGDRAVTYGALDERTTRVAHALRARGARRGGTVAVMLPNRLEFFETGIAISKLDAGMVPVNCHLKTDEVAWILADSKADVLVTDQSLRAAWDGATSIPVLDVDSGDYLSGEGEQLTAGPAPSPVFYTSGTTGRPKGVVHGLVDRERMATMMQGQAALWSWTADDVYIVSGPAYHAGPGGWASTALFVGATVVVLPSFSAREWLRLVDRHRVTKSFMVPAHFIRLLEVPEHERAAYDLSSLRLIVHAAAPCPEDVKRRAMEMLAPCEVWELYGASEGGATRISPSEWLSHPGSVGLPWPGVEVRILSPSGEQLPAGEAGLVYVRPAGGARFHYHDDPDKTAAAWVDDAFTVGDVGYLDADGYLYLTDRASDMVIRGGVNIYPREIEDVLHRHPEVVDCAVFGVPDARLGEQLLALVEVRPGASITGDDLRDWCQASLADFKVPATVELVGELPRDAAGKVRKRVLRDEYWKGRARAI